MGVVAGRTGGPMPPERPVIRSSQWERRRAAWYRDSARTHIAEAAGPLTISLVVCAILAFWSAWEARADASAIGWGAAGVAATGLAWGLYTARDWARRLGGWLAAVIATLGTIALVVSLVTDVEPPGRILWGGIMLLAWMFIAVDLLGAESARKLRRAQAIADGEEETPEE